MWTSTIPGKPYRLVTYVNPTADVIDEELTKFDCSWGIRHFPTIGGLLTAVKDLMTSTEARVYRVEGFKLIDGEWEPIGVMQ